MKKIVYTRINRRDDRERGVKTNNYLKRGPRRFQEPMKVIALKSVGGKGEGCEGGKWEHIYDDSITYDESVGEDRGKQIVQRPEKSEHSTLV